MNSVPVIAIVGRPNVGKSTLFNCVTGTRDALVAEVAGLTRDRQYGEGSFDEKPFIVIDTGGLSGEEEGIDGVMAEQSRLAIVEADIVLFVVSARDGITPGDQNIVQHLRRSDKPVFLVANKIDGLDPDMACSELYALGLGEPFPIAASHRRGIHQLMSLVLADVDVAMEEEEEDDGRIRVAIVGRPNVGKSTLTNRMLGEERVIVYDMPGTTRDSIKIPMQRHEQEYLLIDTAGVRRKGKTHETAEKFSVVKTLQAIRMANVVIMVVDATTNVVDQDLGLLGYILESGRALVIAINKWDGLDSDLKDEIRDELDRRLNFVKFARTHFISAKHGTGVGNLFKSIDEAYKCATQEISTAMLTKILEQAVRSHQPPLVSGRRIKLRYAHSGGRNPPRVIIHGNQVDKVPGAYERYLNNYYRKSLKLVGTPVHIEFRGGDNPFAGKKNDLSDRQQKKRRRLMKHVKK